MYSITVRIFLFLRLCQSIYLKMKFVLLFVFVFLSITIKAQMSEEVEELIKLGRDSVIQLAIEQLKTAGFTSVDPESFDRLRIKTNDDEIQVLFDRSIHYIPKQSRVIHQASVRLLEKATGWTPLENDYEDKSASFFDDISFYEYTEEDKKAIEFILTDEMNIQENDRLVIYEKDEYYDVTVEFETTEGGYKVDKKTGKRYDEWHAHLIPDPFAFDDGFRDVEW
jgi:hypothetical protein